MSNIVPKGPDGDGANLSLRPSRIHYKHPDPRLADQIVNACICGIPISRIAAIFQVDERTLKHYYSPELEHARDYLTQRLTEKTVQMALEGNEKILIYAMNKIVGLEEKAAKKKQSKEEEEKPELQSEGLDLSKLTVEEIRTMQALFQKAKPSIPVKPAEKARDV